MPQRSGKRTEEPARVVCMLATRVDHVAQVEHEVRPVLRHGVANFHDRSPVRQPAPARRQVHRCAVLQPDPPRLPAGVAKECKSHRRPVIRRRGAERAAIDFSPGRDVRDGVAVAAPRLQAADPQRVPTSRRRPHHRRHDLPGFVADHTPELGFVAGDHGHGRSLHRHVLQIGARAQRRIVEQPEPQAGEPREPECSAQPSDFHGTLLASARSSAKANATQAGSSCRQTTLVEMPPRTRNSPVTVRRRGASSATRSSQMSLVTRSWKAPTSRKLHK